MSPFFPISWFLLPFLVSSVIVNIDPLTLNNATFIHQSFYMYTKDTAPAVSEPGNGRSFINLSLEINKGDPSLNGKGMVEMLIVPENSYNQIGYYNEHKKRIVCCDAEALKDKQCTVPYKLILSGLQSTKYAYAEMKFDGVKQSKIINYDIPKEGKYYVVIGACSPDTQNLQLKGETYSMNPYGHAPGRMFGIISFTQFFFLVYLGLCCIWFYRIFKYYRELMSIHVLISIVLVITTLTTYISRCNLVFYNMNGFYHPFPSIMTLFFNTLSHTLLRCLLLLISKGLGISSASLGSSFWSVLFLCICYYVNSIAYEYTNKQTVVVREDYSNTNVFMFISIGLDVILYFWIIKSLFGTIEDLRQKKQTSKLEVFITLRNVFIFLVLIATLYNVLFSYLVMEQIIQSLWKIQWLFSEGVWILLYAVILSIIMYLWAPNERSTAYAFHQQIATDEKVDVEEYAMPEVELQTTGGKVEVKSVDESVLKPMQM